MAGERVLDAFGDKQATDIAAAVLARTRSSPRSVVDSVSD
jgi:hypothetical protein